MLTPAAYAEVLDGLGTAKVTAISKVYPVVLSGAEGLIEWTKGTALVPYLSRLGQADTQRFLDAYLGKLKRVFPGERVYYAFTRVLFTAEKPIS